jgi:non-specific serine/threonine protein kinase
MMIMQCQFGSILLNQDRFAEAEQHFGQAFTGFRELGSEDNAANALNWLAFAAYGRGDLDQARSRCEEALALSRELGSMLFAATSLETLGFIACARGDFAQAVAALSNAFAQGRVVRHHRGAVVRLAGVAVLAVGCGSNEPAVRLLGAAERQMLLRGMRLASPHRTAFDQAMAAARMTLGDERYAAAWKAGQALTAAEAEAEANAFLAAFGTAPGTNPPGDQSGNHGLTRRELDVLRLLAEGRSDQEIADTLFVSRRTAATHVANIYRKLGLSSRAAAAAFAVRHDLA